MISYYPRFIDFTVENLTKDHNNIKRVRRFLIRIAKIIFPQPFSTVNSYIGLVTNEFCTVGDYYSG